MDNLDNATKVASMVMGLGGTVISLLVWLSGQRNKRTESETASEKADRELREARAVREVASQELERKRLGDEVWLIVKDLRIQVGDVRSEGAILKARIGVLENQADAQDRLISDLRNENVELRGDLSQAKMQVASLNAQNSKQASDLVGLQDENRSLKARVQHLETSKP